jgi:DNA invertase Pin-like site-specific DNA recombinase
VSNHKTLKTAVAYLRTSSAANVGADKDSETRQRLAIEAYAKAAGYRVIAAYYDEAVRGADAITNRKGFTAMMERVAQDGVKTIIVETASRLARDLMVQEVAYAMLRDQGIGLVAADSPESFLDDGPTATLIRQVLGAVSQFEKAMLVGKLKGARDRKRADGGAKAAGGQRRRKRADGAPKVEGRKSYVEMDAEMVSLAKKLHRYPVDGKRRSLRGVSAALAEKGYQGLNGKPYAAMAIKRMVESKMVVDDQEPMAHKALSVSLIDDVADAHEKPKSLMLP